jgi:hypothetical protein
MKQTNESTPTIPDGLVSMSGGVKPSLTVQRLAERIRVNAEGALAQRGDDQHVARSLECIAEDAVTLLVELRTHGVNACGNDKPKGDSNGN